MQWKFWLEGVLIPAVGLPGFLGEDHDGRDDGDDYAGDNCHGKGSDDVDDEACAGDNCHGGEEMKVMMSEIWPCGESEI